MTRDELQTMLNGIPDAHRILSVVEDGGVVKVTTEAGDWNWLFAFTKNAGGAWELWRRVPVK